MGMTCKEIARHEFDALGQVKGVEDAQERLRHLR